MPEDVIERLESNVAFERKLRGYPRARGDPWKGERSPIAKSDFIFVFYTLKAPYAPNLGEISLY